MVVPRLMNKYGSVDEEFASNLVTWSEVIRKTFFDGGVDEVISTRQPSGSHRRGKLRLTLLFLVIR